MTVVELDNALCFKPFLNAIRFRKSSGLLTVDSIGNLFVGGLSSAAAPAQSGPTRPGSAQPGPTRQPGPSPTSSNSDSDRQASWLQATSDHIIHHLTGLDGFWQNGSGPWAGLSMISMNFSGLKVDVCGDAKRHSLGFVFRIHSFQLYVIF